MKLLTSDLGEGIRRISGRWVPVIFCAALVFAAGARLVQLSLQRHATEARSTAQQLATHSAASLQTQLQSMESLAGRRAQQAAQTAPALSTIARLQSLPAVPRSFWLTADGQVMTGNMAHADSAAIQAIASEANTSPAAASASAHLIGPVRQGSRWLVAAAAPLALQGRNGALLRSGWSVAYDDLDELLLGARLPELTRSGYDFELSSFDAASGRLLPVTGTSDAALTDPVLATVAAPGGGSWQLALRPRAGWYPADELVVDISLLLLTTWLVGLGVRDVIHHMSQLRAALAVSRRRLRNAQQQLAQEVEQRLRLQKSFEHAHYHDSFTGLPNRHFLLSQLDRCLRDMRTRSGRRVAVLLVAVDRFKIITDTLGRTAGDELMVQITRLFAQALSSQEHVIARWGDDELAVLLAEVPDAEAVRATAQTLQQTLQAPIELRRHRIVVATSIGATCVESGLQRTEEVLREADIALYSAKTPGGSNLVTYSASMQHQLMHLVSLEGDLHAALERDEFRLLFQPIVDLRERHIVGVEVLLRWYHPLEGLLTPDRFLSFAEESGLIVPITRWIIQRACRLAGEWRRRLPTGQQFYTSINLSPAALLDPGLTDYVAQVLEQTATPPSALKFELTENGLISNVGAAREVLDRLHAMGIELMLDDFGTGYSSLSHLQLFPFDYIKIDGPMESLSADQNLGALIRAMTQMASTLGLKTIAEVVETPAAVDALEQIGCEYAQGNVFCEPVSADQAVRRLIADVLGPLSESEEPADSATMILPVLPEEI
jgi:diguanylate cyclase (GGDEF)-like protein